MNERIKLLAEQAKAQYCDLSDASCFKRLGLVEAVVFKPEDLEKFAELIVKETLMVARVGMELGPSMAEAVYNYFGVEL